MPIGTVTLEAAQLYAVTTWIMGYTDMLRSARVVMDRFKDTADDMEPPEIYQLYQAFHDSHLSHVLGGSARVLSQIVIRGIDMRTKYEKVPLLINGQPTGLIEQTSLDIHRSFKGVEFGHIEKRNQMKKLAKEMFGVRDPKKETEEHDDNVKRLLSKGIWLEMPKDEEQALYEQVINDTRVKYYQAFKVMYNYDTRAVTFYRPDASGEMVAF